MRLANDMPKDCFNCDELFAPGHRCKLALFHIVMVEWERDCEDEEITEESTNKLSLNAIWGEQTNETLPGSC